ncbi:MULTISPECIES: hypothetical protein [unclassified Halomonas]|uniref:hypothetical protein n=1 Tax=unclassified Halomonas TaxID=2609666 RepID=UPI0020A1C3EF|nr:MULTISPECIES: hypothetical protein [unclassified Halomonas]MCP1313013.1 hypothetical protein [Halomonas sp. 707D7]MCP1326087.1 hypothetical protein [Halomonas sp. 707D4]
MKPRIEKKVSKNLSAILGDELGHVWIDDEYEPHFHHGWPGEPLSAKQVRENRQGRVRVNHMPSVGGELDYWGEGQDWRTLYQQACGTFMWDDTIFGEDGPYFPKNTPRINARWCLRKAREYMDCKERQ